MKTGTQLIAEERRRQIEKEGHSSQHDQEHNDEQLAKAAAGYAIPEYMRNCHGGTPQYWPFDKESWKPSPGNRIKELIKAGALIAAEIDRLQTNEVKYPHDLNPIEKSYNPETYSNIIKKDLSTVSMICEAPNCLCGQGQDYMRREEHEIPYFKDEPIFLCDEHALKLGYTIKT